MVLHFFKILHTTTTASHPLLLFNVVYRFMQILRISEQNNIYWGRGGFVKWNYRIRFEGIQNTFHQFFPRLVANRGEVFKLYLPVHFFPFPENPDLQRQWWAPAVLVHTASTSQSWVLLVHSFISRRRKECHSSNKCHIFIVKFWNLEILGSRSA